MQDFLNKFPDIAVLKDKNIDKKVGNIKESLSAPRNPTAVVPSIAPQIPKYKPNPIPASQAVIREHNLPKFGSIANIHGKGNLVSNILSGGLGNWIFKILAGLGYSEKYGKQYVICKSYIHDGAKPHEQKLLPYINRIFPNLTCVDILPNAVILEEEKQMNYTTLPLRLENVLLKGYFQDIDYFPSKERIPVIKTKHYENTYFIHIRAGDYLLFPGEWEFNIKKYHEACFSILGNVKYIVFSNDNNYAQNYIKQFNIDYTLSNKDDPVDTLIEMANCAGGICTNSSFSWLGAFFQGDKRGQIFMPSVWNKIKDCRGIYPQWATIINVDTGNEIINNVRNRSTLKINNIIISEVPNNILLNDELLKMPRVIKIPLNLFQTWKTKNLSKVFQDIVDSWKIKNPEYNYQLFDDNDCEEFIKQNFDEKVYYAYSNLKLGAFKADLFRYCVLYIHGGVYADIDTICINKIEYFLDGIDFATPIDFNTNIKWGKYNLFNAFIASVPRHPILLDCINRIVYNMEHKIIPSSSVDLTGPGVLGRAVNTFLKKQETSSFVNREGTIDNILLLKFELETEFIKNELGYILFQNKNGNKKIKAIYDKEAITNEMNPDWDLQYASVFKNDTSV